MSTIEQVLSKHNRIKSDHKGFKAINTNWIIMIALIVADINLRNAVESPVVYAFTAVAILIISSRIRAFENLIHEASHYHLFKTSNNHQKFAFLYTYIVFKDLNRYRKDHNEHHKVHDAGGDWSQDPDHQRMQRLGAYELPKNYWWIVFVRPMIGYHFWEAITETILPFFQTSGTELFSRIAFCFGAPTMLAYAFGTHSVLMRFGLYYVIPYYVLSITRFWSEMAEHTHLMNNKSRISSSRSNIGFIHRYFINPHSDGFHTVHHLDKMVPWYELKAAHVALEEKVPEYNSLIVSSYGVIETFKQLYYRDLNVRAAKKVVPIHRTNVGWTLPSTEHDEDSSDEITEYDLGTKEDVIENMYIAQHAQ
jgi:fatty acid desaturase